LIFLLTATALLLSLCLARLGSGDLCLFLPVRFIVAPAALRCCRSGLFLSFRIRLLPATAAFVLVAHGLIPSD
jgi:hypothetical protein